MKTKKILMACSNHWTSIFQVGSHHLAREFLKLGYEVAFVSDPISPFHVFTSKTVRERFAIYQKGGVQEGKLWAYTPATLLPPQNRPLLRSEWVHQNWHQMTLPSVVDKVKERGFGEVDILYFDGAIQSFWLKEIRARKTVFRMADQNAGFQRTTPSQLKLEKELIRNVDLVLCTAKTLVDSIQGEGKQVEHLPNGVPFAHFNHPRTLPPEYKHLPKPIAVYVGAMEYWFDHSLIRKMAQELPHVSFVLIGPCRENRFQAIPNIHFLGPKAHSDIPAYLQFADVGLIPFDVQGYPDLVHHVNPLKLYEYMASGLPVVATGWKELENIDSPAHLCYSREEFKAGIVKALDRPDRNLFRSYAKELDWFKKAADLLSLLGVTT